jgi:hypothetical protein
MTFDELRAVVAGMAFAGYNAQDETCDSKPTMKAEWAAEDADALLAKLVETSVKREHMAAAAEELKTDELYKEPAADPG